MYKELEEATKWIKERIVYIAENCDLTDLDNKKAYDSLKTVLNYIDNSISKEVIEKKIEEYKKMLMSCNRFSDVDRIKALNERILALQELLEGK